LSTVAAGKGIPTDYMKELNSIVDGRSHDIDGLAFPHTGHAIEVSSSVTSLQ
jgi:hypothetical protein